MPEGYPCIKTCGEMYNWIFCINSYISSALAGNPGLNLITALRDIAGNSAGRKLVYDFMLSEAGKAAISAENFASIVSTLADNNKDESFIAQVELTKIIRTNTEFHAYLLCLSMFTDKGLHSQQR